jgi:MFS family permease
VRLSVSFNLHLILRGTLLENKPDGRRPVYIIGIPFLCIGSLGVATATRIPALMFWRMVQAFGSSGGLSVG